MYGQICLSSSVPLRSPASEKGWQGYPAVRMSQSGTNLSGAMDNSSTSPLIGTLGQCFAKTCWQNISLSQNITGTDNPAHWKEGRLRGLADYKSKYLANYDICWHNCKITDERWTKENLIDHNDPKTWHGNDTSEIVEQLKELEG